MLRCCIGLDLYGHPCLSVDQRAFTGGLIFVSGVIRLQLPNQCCEEDLIWFISSLGLPLNDFSYIHYTRLKGQSFIDLPTEELFCHQSRKSFCWCLL
jgi:hypothetical protein